MIGLESSGSAELVFRLWVITLIIAGSAAARAEKGRRK